MATLMMNNQQTLPFCLTRSCYLPHPDKEATGGEDGHFICEDAQAIGVADGVGGWADVGVNAGFFSCELMSHSVRAIQEEPEGCFNPVRVLEKAHSCTKSKGSSTACIIGLTEKVTAQKKAVLACQQALDKNRQSPFLRLLKMLVSVIMEAGLMALPLLCLI